MQKTLRQGQYGGWGQPLVGLFGWLLGIPGQQQMPVPVSRYIARKRELPNTFTTQQWRTALDYWDHRCAVCERPRGLWHTVAADHWVPLTAPDCPGTMPTNIVPLCHGADGCNNSKGAKRPEVWLQQKLGKRRGNKKLAQINSYFDWVQDNTFQRFGCPVCGKSVTHLDDLGGWRCHSCAAQWTDRDLKALENCPKCQCWMVANHGTYECPRCNLEWDRHNLPTRENCPGCHRGHLHWTFERGGTWGYWHCNRCTADWTFQ
jgi:hypothetical protein